MKKLILFISITIFFLFLGYVLLNQKEFIRSEKSPDENYVVEIYVEKRFFAAPGDGGNGMTYIKLLDTNNNKIGESNDICQVFLRDIEIRWDIKNNYVWFAPARAINIKDGSCEL